MISLYQKETSLASLILFKDQTADKNGERMVKT